MQITHHSLEIVAPINLIMLFIFMNGMSFNAFLFLSFNLYMRSLDNNIINAECFIKAVIVSTKGLKTQREGCPH